MLLNSRKSKSLRLFFILITCFLTHNNLLAQIHLGMPYLMGKGGSGTAFVAHYQTIGVNAANLGFYDDQLLTIGILNFGLDISSRGLSNFDLLTYRSTISPKDVNKFRNVFRDDGFNLNTAATWLAGSVITDQIGGFAFSVRDRASTHISLSEQVSDILFQGREATYFMDTSNLVRVQTTDLIDEAQISFMHYRELNLSYGVKVIDLPTLKLHAGIGYKYLYGLGYLDVRSQLGEFSARSSFLGSYEVTYDEVDIEDPDLDNSFFNASGNGQAFDLGATLVVGEAEDKVDNFIISMALTDIGYLKWSRNTLAAANATVDTLNPAPFESLHSLAVKDITALLFDSSGIFRFENTDPFTTRLPASLRFGIGKQFNNILQLSLDFIAPLNQQYSVSFQDPYIVFGADLKVVEGMFVSTGISRNNALRLNLPFGFRYSPGSIITYEFATADVSTFFRGNSSRMSFAFGIRLNVL